MVIENAREIRPEKPRIAEPELLMDRDILNMLVRENYENISKFIFPMIRRWLVGDLGNVTVAENELCLFINDLILAREKNRMASSDEDR